MVSVAWNSSPETNRMKLELHRFKKSNDPDIERELFLGKDLGVTDTAAEEIGEFRDERQAWAEPGDAGAQRPRTSPPACTPTAGEGVVSHGVGRAALQEVSGLQSNKTQKGGAEKGQRDLGVVHTEAGLTGSRWPQGPEGFPVPAPPRPAPSAPAGLP